MTRKHSDIDAGAMTAAQAYGDQEDGGLFVFGARPVVRDWPVRVTKPVDGGLFQEFEIRMDLRYVDFQSYKDLTDAIGEWAMPHGAPGHADYRPGGRLGDEGDPLHAYVHGWSGLKRHGPSGKAVDMPFSAEARAELLADMDIRQGVLRALVAMCKRVPEKNSETPPDAGQPANRQQRRAAQTRKKKSTA